MLKANLTEILSLVTLIYSAYLWCRNIFLLIKGIRTAAIVDRSSFYARIKYSVNGINLTKQFFRLAVEREDEDTRNTTILYHPKYHGIITEDSIFSLYLVPGIFTLVGIAFYVTSGG